MNRVSRSIEVDNIDSIKELIDNGSIDMLSAAIDKVDVN